MKKILSILLASAMICLLAACGAEATEIKTQETAAAEVTASTQENTADNTASDARKTLENAAASAILEEGLEQLRQRYFPGTAGCSLNAAACAAALADGLNDADFDEDSLRNTVEAYVKTLSEEDRALFAEQAEGLRSAFETLTGENGQGLLADCGYAAVSYPWNAEKLTPVFEMICDAASVSGG